MVRRPVSLSRTALIEGTVAIGLLAAVLLLPDPDTGSQLLDAPAAAVVLAVLGSLAVALRRWLPVVSLLVVSACAAGVTGVTGAHTPAQISVLLVLYVVGFGFARPRAIGLWALSAAVLIVGGCFGHRDGPVLLDLLSYLAWTGLATAIGNAVRTRRDYVAAVEERAERAEQALGEEARRQVIEERVRIARELHDVVAHHMAVVTVQAGVAGHLVDSDPAAAKVALGHVTRAGRAVLDELGGILTVLRDPSDTGGEPETTAPAPGLNQLDALLASLAAAGLAVDLSRRGTPQALGPALDLVAFRVLQEALTNAQKHGTGSAHALIAFGHDSLALRIVNPLRAGVARSSGHGLTGMRERAAAVGGELTAQARRDGVFQVEAVLPLVRSSP